MESNSSGDLSEEREYVDTNLNTTSKDRSDLISFRDSPNHPKKKKNTSFQANKAEDDLSDKFTQKRLILALEQEKTLRKLYESKNNILKNALTKLTNTNENPQKISSIKSANNIFTSTFNSNKRNSILEKLQNMNIKKTLTRNNLFAGNALDMDEILNKDLATNEMMKSEVNLLNLETKSLHTPKELEQENLRNFDLNLLNGADNFNYIDTENADCLLYPDNHETEFNKLTISDNLNTLNTISHTEEPPLSITPNTRNNDRGMNNSCIGSEVSTYRLTNQTTSKTNKNQPPTKRNYQTNKSVVTNKKAVNTSSLQKKTSSSQNYQTHKPTNIKTINTGKYSSRVNDTTKKTPMNKNTSTKVSQPKDRLATMNKPLTSRTHAPKLTINPKKKTQTSSASNLNKKSIQALGDNNKYLDIMTILDNIFGENLDNYSDKTLQSALETFDNKHLTKAFILTAYTQREMIRGFEDKEFNVNELNKQISLQEQRIGQLTKEIEMMKKKGPSSRTPVKSNFMTEESLNTSRISGVNRLTNNKFNSKNLNDESLIERKLNKKKYIK